MPVRKRPTIYDLMKVTGFSRGTISRAFNDIPTIKKETREAVLKAASEIGYVPHAGARGLTLGKTNRYGLLLPNLDNPYYSGIFQQLDHVLRKHRKSVLLGLHHNDETLIQSTVIRWISGEIDGLVMDLPHYLRRSPFLDNLRALQFPTVFLHNRPTTEFSDVVHHRMEAYASGIEQMIAQGHRRIGYIGIGFGDSFRTESYRGYQSGLEKGRLPFDEALVHFAETNDAKGGIEGFEALMALKSPPTAFACFNDILACGVVQAATDRGLRLRADYSLLGADNIPEASRHGLTTVGVDLPAMARSIFDLMERQKTHPIEAGKKGKSVVLENELISRQSIGPVAPGSAR